MQRPGVIPIKQKHVLGRRIVSVDENTVELLGSVNHLCEPWLLHLLNGHKNSTCFMAV